MSHSQAQHASKITARFTQLIGPDLSAQIGNEHLSELALIIESAIDSSVLEAENAILTKLQNIVDETRRSEEQTTY